MKRNLVFFMMVAVILLNFSVPTSDSTAASYSGFPYFNIISVAKDQTVTIQAYNFPSNDSYSVTMGVYGSLGVGGIVVGTTNTGNGGAFVATYQLPVQLVGLDKIAIRMQSASSGYYAYNWFYNTAPSQPAQPGYSGYPYFFITTVEKDRTVTIQAYNFPANDEFSVRMGAYGTLGIGGTQVATVSSGAGGSFTATYNVPALLAGSLRIAIRLESAVSGYYAYNWFYNNTATVTTDPNPPATPSPQAPDYRGYPYFYVSSVVRDQTVTIDAHNFPPNDTFVVRLGPYGSLGIGGTVVETLSTSDDGSFSKTFPIPAQLNGSFQIAIRMDGTVSGYYAYNWFYNNTTP